jgi:hypothetical protein
MTKRSVPPSSEKKLRQPGDKESVKALEQHILAIAEQLGRIAGSAHAKTDSWLDQPNFRQQLTRIRDRAATLLERFAASRGPNEDNGPDQNAKPLRSGGKVDAPGKKHRKAPAAVHGVKHSDQRIPKAIAASRAKRGPRQG